MVNFFNKILVLRFMGFLPFVCVVSYIKVYPQLFDPVTVQEASDEQIGATGFTGSQEPEGLRTV